MKPIVESPRVASLFVALPALCLSIGLLLAGQGITQPDSSARKEPLFRLLPTAPLASAVIVPLPLAPGGKVEIIPLGNRKP